MIEADNSDLIFSKRKAINALFPYAICLEQGLQQAMIDVILRSARVSDSRFPEHGKFLWHHVVLYISRLYEKRSPTSLNRVITLLSPFLPWYSVLNNAIAVSRWATAASEIPYTNEVGRSVIETLSHILGDKLIRAYIPIEMWEWMKRSPSLPPMYHDLRSGESAATVAHVRRLGDIDLLKSYFLHSWASVGTFPLALLRETESSIREDFSGIGMEPHRKDLMECLDHVLGELDQLEESSVSRKIKTQYTRLKGVLSKVNGE